jgi:TRAP-type C4-dicarboxylate transport system permease small subunit
MYLSQAGSAGDTLVALNLRLRKTVGWVGILLPFALYLGNKFVHPNFHPVWPTSLSSYYYTHMRILFVGALCALGLLFITYNGYDKVDRWITNIAGMLAISAAFVPATPTRPPNYHGGIPFGYQRVLGEFHAFIAAALFVTLALIALRFTKTGPGDKNAPVKELRRLVRELWYSPPRPGDSREPLKRRRDAVYRVCARLILAAIVLAAISNVMPDSVAGEHPLFFIEAVAVFCFGVSWFVKGQAVLADSGLSLPARLRRRLSGASAA